MELLQFILCITASASAIRVPVWHNLELHPSSSTRLKTKSRFNNVHNSWHNNPKTIPEAALAQANHYTNYKINFPTLRSGPNNNINKSIKESKNINEEKRVHDVEHRYRPHKTIQQYAKQYDLHPKHYNSNAKYNRLKNNRKEITDPAYKTIQAQQASNVIKSTYPNQLNYNNFNENNYLRFTPSAELPIQHKYADEIHNSEVSPVNENNDPNDVPILPIYLKNDGWVPISKNRPNFNNDDNQAIKHKASHKHKNIEKPNEYYITKNIGPVYSGKGAWKKSMELLERKDIPERFARKFSKAKQDIYIDVATSPTSSDEIKPQGVIHNSNIQNQKYMSIDVNEEDLSNHQMHYGRDALLSDRNDGHKENLREESVQDSENIPTSEHEIPNDAPTRPIYPGEGVWAIPGIKHYPYINNIQFANSEDNVDDLRPDGYDTFESEHLRFENKQNSFQDDLQKIPTQLKLATKISAKEEENDEDENENQESSATTEFVPVRLYAQVRKYEDEEHLPASVLEPRLRKIVTDSKVHTVYTEEGYEDSAYNHAGHEKNAENNEGYVEFDKEAHNSKDVEDSEAEGSSYAHPTNAKKTNNFAQTELTKTTEIKDIGDGNMEHKSKNKLKYMMTPNNSSELHSYIKILPSTIKITKSFQIPSNQTINNTSLNVDNISSLNYTKMNNTKLELDTNTAVSIMKDIEGHFATRTKRDTEFVNDFPIIETDTDFIDKIVIKETEPNIDTTYLKYPYYNNPFINKNSALRYAQDMKDIPIKTANKMAFYDQANKIECQEVESEVNPVPGGLDNGESPDGESTRPSFPRLTKLGDKIDCFKMKYFGENPLDSPIFTEDVIEMPQPIFKEFEQLNEVITKVQHKTDFDEPTNKPIYQQIAITNLPQVHDLVDYDEVVTISSSDESKINLNIAKSFNSTNRQPKVSDLIFDIQNKSDNNSTSYFADAENVTLYAEEGKVNEFNATYDMLNSTESLPGSLPLRLRRRRRKRPQEFVYKFDQSKPMSRYPLIPQTQRFNELYPSTTASPKPNGISEVHYKDDIKPSEQLNVFADIINNIKNSSRELMLHEASENQHVLSLQTPTYPYIQQNMRRNKTPSNRNKIKTKIGTERTRDVTQDVYKNFYHTSTMRPTGFVTKRKRNKTPTYNRNEQVFGEYMNALKKNIAFQGNEDVNIDNFHPIINEKPRILNNMQPHLINNKSKIKRRPQYTFVPQEMTDIETSPSETIISGTQPPKYLDENLSSVGTVSASTNKYINKQKQMNPSTLYTTIDVPLNRYYVPGMKPPPSLEKPYVYSDFKLINTNHISRRNAFINHRMRKKRSASRLTYAEIKRGPSRRPNIEDNEEVKIEEEEEYIPHRPTNYHYDTETDQIVYDKTEKIESIPEEEENEYEDIEEETTKKLAKPVKPTTAPHRTIFHKDVMNKKNGLTLVDFLAKLKSDAKYHEIPDPKPIEKPTSIGTTQKPAKTTPPAFLSFLNKLHNSDGYKIINDEEEAKKAKVKQTTTTVQPEEEIIKEDEEEVASNMEIKNSPGGQFLAPGQLQIFDISDFLPKAKTYAPRTSIDYSKYKTIERTTVNSRHNLSSRYSEDEDELPLNKQSTSQEPIVELNRPKYEDSNSLNRRRNPERTPVIEKPGPSNHYEENDEEESSYPEEISTTTTTTEKSSTESVIQMRFRGRKRPTTTRGTTTITPDLTTGAKTTPIVRHTHRPPMRVYEKRPRPRIRIRTTTPTEPDDAEQTEATTKKSRRRTRKLYDESTDVPFNHKAFYTPIFVEARSDKGPVYSETNKQPRLVTPDILNYNKTNAHKDKPGEINPRKIDFEVFKMYDKSKRHGGNYVRNPNKKDVGPLLYETEDAEEIKQSSDIDSEPLTYYDDTILPSKINTLKHSLSAETSDEDDYAENIDADTIMKDDQVKDYSIAKTDDYDYKDEVKVFFNDGDTKKTVIVKDPSKRLYFYAPVK